MAHVFIAGRDHPDASLDTPVVAPDEAQHHRHLTVQLLMLLALTPALVHCLMLLFAAQSNAWMTMTFQWTVAS